MLVGQIKEIFANPQSLVNSPHPTIFHELMEAKDRSIFSEQAFLDEGWLFLFAGTDTSSDSVTVGTLMVLGDPLVYARLNKELLEAWPKLEDKPPYEVLESLPYLVRWHAFLHLGVSDCL